MYRETEYYQNKANRDARYLEIKRRGFAVRKSSCSRSVLDPHAVVDFQGSVSPNGFGGAAARWFAKLYMVEY